jgi:hypothetical protein
VFTIVGVVAIVGLLFQQLGSVKARKIEDLKPALNEAQRRDNEFTQAKSQLDQATNELGQLASLIGDRYYWLDTMPELRRVLMHVQTVTSNKWGSATGIWIEQFVTPAPPEPSATGGDVNFQSQGGFGSALEQAIETKYSLGTPDQQGGAVAPVGPAPGSGVSTIVMVCRARKGADASANSELMYTFLDTLRASPIVDAKDTQVGGRMGDDDSPYTFTFAVKVALKTPLKL